MIKNLVLSAAGINGYIFLGGIKYLMEKNLLDNLENILGTSVGSILGLLYILGFTIDEIIELATKISPDTIFNITGKNVISFISDYGIDNGEKIIKIIKIICEKKVGNSNITFQELYNIKNITFTVSALNVNKKSLVYFSHKNYPNLEVYKAIRMSTSIPIIFKPYIFEDQYFVDGGVIDPCSLDFFKNTKETLVFMISSKKNIKIKNITDYLTELVFSPIEKVIDNYYDKPNIIIFESKDNEGLDFEIKKDRIKELIENGFNITKEEINDILEYFTRTSL
tara:strand:+ start:652 stop:1494 length:843 start_codon:yes stop_codon:yes gene_type:complete